MGLVPQLFEELNYLLNYYNIIKLFNYEKNRANKKRI